MHFEKLTKGTPHEPRSPMNNNTYPRWLINHQGIQAFFWKKKAIALSLLLAVSAHIYCNLFLCMSLQLIRSSWDLTCTRAHATHGLKLPVGACHDDEISIYQLLILKKKHFPNDRFLIKTLIKKCILRSSQRVPLMSPGPPWIITPTPAD